MERCTLRAARASRLVAAPLPLLLLGAAHARRARADTPEERGAPTLPTGFDD